MSFHELNSKTNTAPLKSSAAAGRAEGASSAASARGSDKDPVRTASTAARLKQAATAPRVVQLRRVDPLEDEAARLRLERRVLAHLSSGRLEVTITDNRHTMISVRRLAGGRYTVRLHHMFLGAPPSVARALAAYVSRNCPEASRELGRFIDENQHIIRRQGRRGRTIPLETRGEHFDLQHMFDRMNEEHFGGKIDAAITWGRSGTRRGRRRNSIKMGSYSVEDRLIRIHPALDREFVPEYFVEWIIFHEMLHQVHDIPVKNGRRVFHTPEFMDAERNFPHYERARRWERVHLDRLLSY